MSNFIFGQFKAVHLGLDIDEDEVREGPFMSCKASFLSAACEFQRTGIGYAAFLNTYGRGGYLPRLIF
jgi:hypothetical protein